MDSRGHSASPHSASAAILQESHQTGGTTTPVSAADGNAATLRRDSEGLTTSHNTENEGTDPALNESAPYGTRSRHRSGNARPDYTEKDENTDDFPAPQSKSVRHQQAASDPKRAVPDAASSSRSNGFQSPSGGKDSIPGTATLPTNPPKKRKAVGAATTTTAAATYIPPANMSREPNMMTFGKSKAILKKGGLVADDGTVLEVDDHVYLVCEPPGDPYYLCRIMEFLHSNSEDPRSPVDSVRVNWFYRPRDVQRHNSDTRLVYGTMHSDVCPLTSLRGKCMILHRSEISNLDEYRKGKDCFWYSQIFDRFIRRSYEVIPTSEIINVPDRVKKALDERWKYIAVEIGRVKELTSAVKSCKRCSQFCASSDSVDCAICHNSYHMNCVRPPLPKKPTRGFAWACGPCSRAHEKGLEARQTPVLGQSASATEEEEVYEEEEEDPAQVASTRAPSPSSEIITDQHPGTQAEIAMAKMWPFRYLGIHCRVEDALQYDDRAIYPRASSRLGPRHQANVNVWHGRPVELVKPAEIKKRYVKSSSHKKDGKLSKETIAAIEADRVEKAKRPKWVQDEPPGYVHRGEDYPADDERNTAQLLFKMPEEGVSLPGEQDHSPAANEAFIDNYMIRARSLAKSIRVADYGSNLLDKALQLLMDENYDVEKALEKLALVDRAEDLKEPILTQDQLKKFEDGVAKYGSEHRAIRLHMKTNLPNSTIVRFYYLWKKTPRGRQIWDHYGGRKGKKRQNMDAAAKMQAEVANDVDDSAYDMDKAEIHKRTFQCKFCSTRHSRQWRRAPGVTAGQTVPVDGKASKDKGNRPMLALCGRCAGLWRRYAIQYEDLDESTRKAAQNGGKGLKRRIDEELLREVLAAHETPLSGTPEAANVALPSIETSTEPPKKKTKTAVEDKKKEKPAPPPKLPTPPPPPIVPDQPRWRDLPCAVCKISDASGEPPVSCSHCKLTVHKRCYGLADQVLPVKWVCDQCANDRNPSVSTDYACTLCTVEETVQELLEPPRVSHKKKTDREREKERLERELIDIAKLDYRNRQQELNRPLMPREPLKRTDGNNWVHVLCATWTPEIRFSQARALEKAEGFSAIPMERYEATCKICKSNKHGSCVSCQQCKANFHVGCAVDAGYTLGFDVNPVKGSRKDQVTTVSLGDETGALVAAIWCKDHAVKTIVHHISEATDDSGKNALQLYVESYKQADQTLTGTARKANLLCQSTKLPSHPAVPSTGTQNRRISMASTAARGARNSSAGEVESPSTDPQGETAERRCVSCSIDVSPKWWPVPSQSSSNENFPGMDRDHDVPMGGMLEVVNGERIKQETSGGDGPGAAILRHGLDVGTEAYCCHKCHWKTHHAPTPTPTSEAKTVPASPPVQTAAPSGWNGVNGEGMAPPAGHLQARSPVPNGQLEPAVLNGRTSQGVPTPAYPQSNGFVPLSQTPHTNGMNGVNGVSSGGSVNGITGTTGVAGVNGSTYSQSHAHVGPSQFAVGHEQIGARHGPGQYGQVNGLAGPSHGPHFPAGLSNAGPVPQQAMNGLRSPQYPLGPPGYVGGSGAPQAQPYMAARTSESSYGAQQETAATNGQHASPALNVARPVTPRDGSVDARLGSNVGASASPNLRNLLH